MALQTITSRLHARAESRQQRRIDIAIWTQADGAAEFLLNRSPRETRVLFTMGQPPNGITRYEFMGWVGIRAISILESHYGSLDNFVYNHTATEEHRQKTDEFAATYPGEQSRGAENLQLVFDRTLFATVETDFDR